MPLCMCYMCVIDAMIAENIKRCPIHCGGILRWDNHEYKIGIRTVCRFENQEYKSEPVFVSKSMLHYIPFFYS